MDITKMWNGMENGLVNFFETLLLPIQPFLATQE